MSKNVDDVIVETALGLLSTRESEYSPNPHVSATEVRASILAKYLTSVSIAYVEMILDDEFGKRYSGKNVVYFLKVK